MSRILYYQIGGYRPHINWFKATYDDKALADAIAGPGSPLRAGPNASDSVDLILGITRHGSSHLLLTEDQVRRFTRVSRLPYPTAKPFLANYFESLSPISFLSVKELAQKLSFLKPKSKGKKGGSGDTSQANRGYTAGVDNHYRASFEHGRVLYRILSSTLTSHPDVYGCGNTSWKDDICIGAFVFNTKGVDDRRLSERTKNPHVLDIGFCNAVPSSLTPDYQAAVHIVNAGNAMLGKKGNKKSFKYGDTEIIRATELPDRIQNLLSGQKKPMILLVNKEEETMNYFRNMGVDVQPWRYGLRGILFGSTENASSNSYHRHQSRSPSPPQRGYQRINSAYPNRQDIHSHNRRPSYAPIYVVDIEQLYAKLMHAKDVQGITDIAQRLGVPMDNGWCAGNEAPVLIDIWKAMVSGLPIDDQRDLRVGTAPTLDWTAADSTPGRSTGPPSHDGDTGSAQRSTAGDPGSDSEDSEDDPNAYNEAQNEKEEQEAPEAAPQAGGYDFDESDYGSDSDESD